MSSQYDLTSARGNLELSPSRKMLLNSSRSMIFSRRRVACTDHRLVHTGFISNHYARQSCANGGLSSNSLRFADHSFVQARGNGTFSTNTMTSIRHVYNISQICNAMAADSAETEKAVELDKHEAFAAARQTSGLEGLAFDVVIVGAGIIGLSIAHRILSTTEFSVALVDAAKPCAGATGAGQGYVWLGHRVPNAQTWHLAERGNFLWKEFARGLHALGLDPLVTIGFKKTGSLLFGTCSEHAFALQERAEALCNVGVQAEFLNSAALRDVEPELNVGAEGCAVLTFDDCQIDANLTAMYILGEIHKYCPSGRFKEFYNDSAVNFLWGDHPSHITGVQTIRQDIYCNRKVIMAAGAWSGELMQHVFKTLSLPHVLATKPRKGHLLVFEGMPQISLRHGLMEFAYEKLSHSSDPFGVASTATMDAKGRLLLGSSRQFVGFDYSLQYDVMENILKKAAEFLPALGNTHLTKALNAGTVRIGHRPYVPDGRPMVGEVPGIKGLLLATGHEGEGLSLSLATAEMIVDLILEKEQHVVDPSPFSPAGRLVPAHSTESSLR
eukprot:c25076_g1_i1 orf=408-2072(+)